MFANQEEAGINESLKQVVEDGLVHLSQSTRQLEHPGLDQGAPPQGGWLHVDHTTARHLHRGQSQGQGWLTATAATMPSWRQAHIKTCVQSASVILLPSLSLHWNDAGCLGVKVTRMTMRWLWHKGSLIPPPPPPPPIQGLNLLPHLHFLYHRTESERNPSLNVWIKASVTGLFVQNHINRGLSLDKMSMRFITPTSLYSTQNSTQINWKFCEIIHAEFVVFSHSCDLESRSRSMTLVSKCRV